MQTNTAAHTSLTNALCAQTIAREAPTILGIEAKYRSLGCTAKVKFAAREACKFAVSFVTCKFAVSIVTLTQCLQLTSSLVIN